MFSLIAMGFALDKAVSMNGVSGPPVTPEELEELDQILVKQLKNRYSDPGTNKRFVIGIDRAKMKLYDLEETAQTDLVERTKNKKKKSMPWKFFCGH